MEKLKLFPYQEIGAKFLSERRAACLFDEMGIGKSAQAIRACDLVKAKTVLVVCKLVAVENWRREFEKFSITNPEVLILNYEKLPKLGPGRFFDVVIVDESHSIKSPTSQRTRNVLGKTGIVHRGKATYLLTGSPVVNNASELWTTLYTFGRTRLNYEQFVERYCTYRDTSYGRQITGTETEPNKVAELRALLRPIALRRTKEDVNLMLPPVLFSDIVVKPGRVEVGLCQTFVNKYVRSKDMMADLEKDLETELGIVKGIVKGGFTEEAMRALEANSKNIMTLRRYNSLQKIMPIVELVTGELNDKLYDKIVIFAIHRDTIVALQEKLAKRFGAVLLFGGTKPVRIQDRIDKFQNSRMCKVMIAQLHAAGTSLTLTAANQGMFVDLDWVPGNNAQAAARIARIGQTKPVTVRCVTLENSIDQHISNILLRKTKEINILMDGALGIESKNKIDVNSIL